MDTFCDFAVLPHTAGKPSARNANHKNQDGKTATLVLMLLVLSFVFVLNYASNIFKDALFNTNMVLVIYGIFVLCGLLACLVIGFVSYFNRLHFVEIGIPRGLTIQDYCLWLFGIPSMIDTALKAGNMINCNYIIESENSKPKIFYYVSTTLFIPVEIIFISYFSTYKLKNSLLTNYTFFLLAIGNLSIWFHSLMLHGGQIDSIPSININSTEFEICLANSTTTTLIKKLRPFVSPIFLEYFLLTLTLARKILSPDECQTDFSTEKAACHALSDENKILENTAENENYNSTNDSAPSSLFLRQIPLVFYIILVFFLIAAAISFIGCLINSQHLLLLTQIALTLKKVFMFGSILAGFMRLKIETTPRHIYHSYLFGEYVFLFTAFWKGFTHSFEFFVSYFKADALSIVKNVINMTQDYLQVTFILHGNRCIPQNSRQSKRYLQWICFFLVVTNFESWFADSFFLLQFPYNRNAAVFSHTTTNYDLSLRLLFPIAVYYRFASTFAFYEMSKKFKYPQNK